MEEWYYAEHKDMVEGILHARINWKAHVNKAPIKAYMEGLVLRHPSRLINYLVGLLANNVSISPHWYGEEYVPVYPTYSTPAAPMIKSWAWRSYVPIINTAPVPSINTAPPPQSVKAPLPYPPKGIIRAQPPRGSLSGAASVTTDASINTDETCATGAVIILGEGADVRGGIDPTKTLIRCGRIPILQPNEYHPLKQQQKLAHHQSCQPQGLSHYPLIAQPIFTPNINPKHPLDRLMVLAELEALRMGLEFLSTYYPHINDPQIFVDCLDLTRGLDGVYSIPEGISYHSFMEVIELVRRFMDFRISHVYREHNMIADRAAFVAQMNLSLFTQCWDEDWKVNEKLVMGEIENILDLNPLSQEMTRFDYSLF